MGAKNGTLDSAFPDRLSDAVDQAVFVLDPDRLTVRSCNDGAVRLFGYRRDELVGHSIEGLYAGRDDFAAFGAICRREFAAGRSFHDLRPMRRRDGAPFDGAHFVAPLHGDQGRLAGATVMVHKAADAQKGYQRLDFIIDSVPVAMAVIRLQDGRVLLANRVCRQMFGLAAGSAASSANALDFFVDPVERDRLLGALLADGEVNGAELQVRRGDGTPTWASVSLRVAAFDGTEVVFGVFLDITEERTAREADRRTQRMLQALIDNAPCHIFLRGRDRQYILQNRLMIEDRRRSGIDPANRASYLRVTPEQAAIFAQQDSDVFEQGIVVTEEYTTTGEDGRPQVRRVTKFPVFDPNGYVAVIGGFNLDVTAVHEARQKAERNWRLLESIIDNAPAHIFLKDLNGTHILQNRRLRDERARAGIDGGDRRSHLLHGERDITLFARQDAEVLRTAASVTEEVTVTPRNGGLRTLRVTKFPVFDERGEVTAIGGFSLDVTRERSLEDRLHQAQKIEAVGQLTGGIAHDFNNLLAVILGNAELLIEALADDPPRRRMAELTEMAADRAAALTERLLAFSRQQELRPSLTDSNELLAGLADRLRRMLGAQIDINMVLAPDLAPVWADRAQLENSIINLAVNARDAMPSGGCLRIESANETIAEGGPPELPPGEYVRLSVSDRGTGMSPTVLARAFDPFFTTKDVGKGTGLGLSMVYGFVRQSNGHIVIDSREGEGTTVILWLPRAVAALAAPNMADEMAEPPGGSETILVVDDEPMLCSFAADELRRLGYQVIEAHNGPEALAAFGNGAEIDLLFTDIVMPGGLRGNELAREARLIKPSLKVLFTTGYAKEAEGGTLPGDEAVAVLRKPYQRVELARLVRASLDAAS